MTGAEVARRWAPGVAVGAVVACLGVAEVALDYLPGMAEEQQALFAVAFGGTIATYRTMPGLGLGGLWILAFIQLTAGVPITFTQLAVAILAYGCGRHGSAATAGASAASIPFVGLLGALMIWDGYYPPANRIYYELAGSFTAVLFVGGVVLAVPWLLGVLLRVLRREKQVRAEQEETARERDQAAELADLREGQARLARDVHDVVGHSLAVILAQAESAQYLPEDDPERIKQTMANIAASARTSLQDVRHVLGATTDRPERGGLDSLIDGVRASGHEVVSAEVGDPRPLPPELDVVAYRALQEMLTNAIRHGRRDEPIFVERHWQDELRIEVSNVVDEPVAAAIGGHGLEGMRRRLESVGGRLDVRPRTEPDRTTFTTTAWLPTGAR